MTDYVYDFGPARPTRAQLAAGNAVAVCRYLKKDIPNSYDLSSDERAQYLSWGLGVLYNAEQNAGDLLEQGPQYFLDYGHQVHDRLLAEGVRADAGINVPLSSDTQVIGDKQTATVMNNYSAFASAVAPFGVIGYAQISILDLLVAEGISPPGAKHWLPSALGWSGFPNTQAGWDAYMGYPHAGMVQLFGGPTVPGTDMNHVIDLAAMGFDWPAGNPYAPHPTPEEDDDMGAPGFITRGADGKSYAVYFGHKTMHAIDNTSTPPYDIATFKAAGFIDTTAVAGADQGAGLLTGAAINAMTAAFADAGSVALSDAQLATLAADVAPLVSAGASLADIKQAFTDAVTNLVITETGTIGVKA